MRRWRKLLFIAMARNATSPIEHFALPVDKTVIVSSHVADLTDAPHGGAPGAAATGERA